MVLSNTVCKCAIKYPIKKMFPQLLLLAVITLINSAVADIVDCKMRWVSPTDPGFYYELYPVPLNGRPSGYDGQSIQQIINWQGFHEDALFKGITTDINFNNPMTYGPNETAQGEIYGNAITVTNFTMMGRGWIIVPVTGIYTFTIDSDYAAGLRITNYTANYCQNPYDASSNIQFSVSSYPGWPQNETTTATVELDAGFPYMIQLAYIHVDESPKLEITMTDPNGVTYDNIADFVEKFDIYDPFSFVTEFYDKYVANITVGWSGNSTTLLSLSSTATVYDWTNVTVTTFYVYGTPTPYVSTTPTSSVITQPTYVSSMSSTESAISSVTLSEYSSSSSVSTTENITVSQSSSQIVNSTSADVGGTSITPSSEIRSDSGTLSISSSTTTSGLNSTLNPWLDSISISQDKSSVVTTVSQSPSITGNSVEASSSFVESGAHSISSEIIYSNSSISVVISAPYIDSFSEFSMTDDGEESKTSTGIATSSISTSSGIHPSGESVSKILSLESSGVAAGQETPNHVSSGSGSSPSVTSATLGGNGRAPGGVSGGEANQISAGHYSVLEITTVVTATVNGVEVIVPTTIYSTISTDLQAIGAVPRSESDVVSGGLTPAFPSAIPFNPVNPEYASIVSSPHQTAITQANLANTLLVRFSPLALPFVLFTFLF